MQRFVVGTLGWGMVVLALASCSSGSPAQGTGGKSGTGGSGTGGTASGTGGTTSTGGSSAGTGGSNSGGTSSGGTSSGGTSSGGTSSGGSSSSGGSGSGGSNAGGASAGSGGSSGGNPGTAGSSTGGNAGAAGGRGGGTGSGGSTPSGGAGGADTGDWIVLFNGKDLTGWTPSPGHAALFAVDSTVGEPAIHVYPTQTDQSTQPQATLRTTQSFSSYVYHEEYKWGTKRFADRKQNARDNGVCFHICNDATVVWPDSLEFQLGATPWGGPGTTGGDNIDWVSGNVFMLVSRTRAQWPNKTVSGLKVYSPTGTKTLLGAPTQYAKGQTDKQRNKDGEWNVIELTVHGSKDATYVVNGEEANALFDMECQVNGTWQPLDKGPIAVQAEFAEVYFRNIKIKMLPATTP